MAAGVRQVETLPQHRVQHRLAFFDLCKGFLIHGLLLIHQGSGGFRGNAPDAVIQMREWEFLVKRNTEILARHSGQPYEKVEQDTNRDLFMSPEDAKAYGIIDAVYNLPGDSLIAQAHDAGLTGGEGSAVTDASSTEPQSQ